MVTGAEPVDKATATAQLSDAVRSVYLTREEEKSRMAASAATTVAPLQQASVRREVSYAATAQRPAGTVTVRPVSSVVPRRDPPPVGGTSVRRFRGTGA